MREALVDGPQLIGDPHAHVAVDEPRRALGVEGDEVERRADLPGGVVRAAQAVLEEVAQERSPPPPAVSGPPTRAVGSARRTASMA